MSADGFNPLGCGPEEIGLREPPMQPCRACDGAGHYTVPAYTGGNVERSLIVGCGACGETGQVRASR